MVEIYPRPIIEHYLTSYSSKNRGRKVFLKSYLNSCIIKISQIFQGSTSTRYIKALKIFNRKFFNAISDRFWSFSVTQSEQQCSESATIHNLTSHDVSKSLMSIRVIQLWNQQSTKSFFSKLVSNTEIVSFLSMLLNFLFIFLIKLKMISLSK